MKAPLKIKTLVELKDWVIKEKPKTIEVSDKSELSSVLFYGLWNYFRGIKIKYIKE